MGAVSVKQFVTAASDLLSANFSQIEIVGEVSSCKESQGKWLFFDLKDENDEKCSINCFMALWNLNIALEDGMKVVVRGTPKLTTWGRFSFTVEKILPVGEGSIKKNFELLKKKLTAEGLFDPAKKREIPKFVRKIGVISSTQAAGYADFVKILNERWGGIKVQVCHTQVQGLSAPGQIIRALNYLNEQSEVEVIVIIRGGGSADDLSAFNDEALTRAVAASKIPVLTGIGHEVDTSLCDLAADIVASTPSNAAQKLTPDKRQIVALLREKVASSREKILSEIDSVSDVHSKVLNCRREIYNNLPNISELKNNVAGCKRKIFSSIPDNFELRTKIKHINGRMLTEIDEFRDRSLQNLNNMRRVIYSRLDQELNKLESNRKILDSLNPELALKKGYAIIRGEVDIGKIIEFETSDKIAAAEVKNIKKKG